MKHPQDEHDVRKAAIEDGMNERAEERATKHSPLPFKVEPDRVAGGIIHLAITCPDEKGWMVCSITPMSRRRAIDEANADFIVTACNSHAELLAACKALARLPIEKCPRCEGTGQRERGEVNEACGQCGGTGEETGNPHPDEIRQARAAIARAEGRAQ